MGNDKFKTLKFHLYGSWHVGQTTNQTWPARLQRLSCSYTLHWMTKNTHLMKLKCRRHPCFTCLFLTLDLLKTPGQKIFYLPYVCSCHCRSWCLGQSFRALMFLQLGLLGPASNQHWNASRANGWVFYGVAHLGSFELGNFAYRATNNSWKSNIKKNDLRNFCHVFKLKSPPYSWKSYTAAKELNEDGPASGWFLMPTIAVEDFEKSTRVN